jgi:hypothetical protein
MNVHTNRNLIPGGAPVIALALLITGIPGCASYDAAGVAPADKCTDPVDHIITVKFEDKGDGKGLCPVGVNVDEASQCAADNKKCVRVTRKKPWIRWTSEPQDVKFGVFFDPLVGPQYISNASGCLRKKINTGVPPAENTAPVEYKYSVAKMGTGKSLDPICDALDPKVIVDH